MTSIKKLVGLTAQCNEIVKRVANGSLDAERVKGALKDIIEKRQPIGILADSPRQPDWYVSPERQLEQVDRINFHDWNFVESDFPAIPEFTPQTPSEVLMLAVYLPDKDGQSGFDRTFREFRDLAHAEATRTTLHWDKLGSIYNPPDQISGHGSYTPGIRWVAFDPLSYYGKSPEYAIGVSAYDELQLAGVEVLMAATLFRGWSYAWDGVSSPFPYLSGLRFSEDDGWTDTPCLRRIDTDQLIDIDVRPSRWVNLHHSSPSIREC